MRMTVIKNPATSTKKIILDTRQPALAIGLNPKIPAIMERTINTTAIVKSIQNIMEKIL